MLTPKVDDETQQHKLFHTRCTVNQHFFTLLLIAVAARILLVGKLLSNWFLNIDKYPKPYTISWIKEVPEVTITERCKISFSIGKYRDKIYCDVVDINACNLLFGKPWHFGLNACHRTSIGLSRIGLINFT